MGGDYEKIKSGTGEAPLRATSIFRASINSHYFGEPLASVESFLAYTLGATIHLVLAWAVGSIWPLLILVMLMLSSAVSKFILRRSSAWHHFEYIVVSIELAAITLIYPVAFIGSVFVALVHTYRGAYAFGAVKGSMMAAPMILAITASYVMSSMAGDQAVSLEVALLMSLSFVMLMVLTFAESKMIGSILQTTVRGDVVNSEISSSLEATFQSIGEAVISVDSEYKISIANTRAVEMFKLSEGEFVGKSVIDMNIFVDSAGVPLPQELNPFVLAKENASTINYRLSTINKVYVLDAAGKPVQSGMTVSPIMSHSKVVGVVAAAHDISGDTDVDKGKSEFVALASHHLRTPINAVRWNLERLLKKDTSNLTDRQKSSLEMISSGNERILSLINNLISVSRFELGALKISGADVDVQKALNTVQDSVATLKKQLEVKMSVSTDSNIPLVHGSDKYAVSLVIENLLTNALYYSDSGVVAVRLRHVEPAAYSQVVGGQTLAAPSGGILLEVTDDGIGIRDLDKKFIFQKFFRTDNGRIVYADGTGLGLYLSRQFVGAIGGKIWFESTLGKGSSFYVFFPLNR